MCRHCNKQCEMSIKPRLPLQKASSYPDRTSGISIAECACNLEHQASSLPSSMNQYSNSSTALLPTNRVQINSEQIIKQCMVSFIAHAVNFDKMHDTHNLGIEIAQSPESEAPQTNRKFPL